MPGSARSRPAIPKVSKILPLAAGGLLVAALVSVAKPALAADTAAINGATTFQTITGFGASEGCRRQARRYARVTPTPFAKYLDVEIL